MDDFLAATVFGLTVFLSFFGAAHLLEPPSVSHKNLQAYCQEQGFYQWEQHKIECKVVQ